MGGSLKIIYILNDSYWYPVLVSAKSALLLFKSEKRRALEFILLVDHVNSEHQRLIEQELTTERSSVRFVQMDLSPFKNFPEYHGTKIMWMRCKLNSLLPDVDDWSCICDGDTLWLKSPEEVFDLICHSDSKSIVYGSYNKGSDVHFIKHLLKRGLHVPEDTYFCVGFVLLHLGQMKKLNGEGLAEEFIQKYGPTEFPEQDIFNVIFMENKKILPQGWGVSQTHLSAVASEDIGLIHYYGGLPWPSSYFSRMSDAESLWWRFAGKYVKACPDDARFKMNPLLYLVMRFWNLLIRIFPSGVISGHDRDARLPVRQLLKKMGNVEA